MSERPEENFPAEKKVGTPEAAAKGHVPESQPDDIVTEPSSPPCYLHELPAPETGGTPPEAKPVSELTPEEQMERFEKQLKEDDWGHQPC